MPHGFNLMLREEVSVGVWVHWIGMARMASLLSKVSVDTDDGLSTDVDVSWYASNKPPNLGHTWRSEDWVSQRSILGTVAEGISTVYLRSVHSLPSAGSPLAMGMEGVWHSAFLC